MPHDFPSFVAEEEAFARSTGKALRAASWEFARTGDQAIQERVRELSIAHRRHFADRGRYEQLKAWREGPAPADPLLDRQLTELTLAYLDGQEDEATIEESSRLSTEQRGLFNRFRAELDGKQWSENDLTQALQTETDSDRLRQVWEAAKQIGSLAAGRALARVRLANESARKLGFRDAYALGLHTSEIPEERLFGILDQLDAATGPAYAREKERLDSQLAERFSIPPDRLRPWHYGDPFFQRPPRAAGPDLDRFFEGKDLERMAVRTFDGLGFDVRPVLARSDLYPRPGKNQHAFCTTIEPDGSDVRILCNIVPSHRWMTTLLHELGHAAHWELGNRDLPMFLVSPPHGLNAESESQLFQRLSSDARWLADVAGVPAAKADALAGALFERERLAQLIMTRWSLVMAHFERAMYANPDGDLSTLWWDLVERYQMVRRPDGRHEPDWAAKIHLATHPGNYYVYILGELAVSQIYSAMVAEAGGFFDTPAAGEFVRERVFRQGGVRDWDATVAYATGSPLGTDAYVREWTS